MKRRTASLSILLLACVALAACGDAEPHVITHVRTLEKPRMEFPPDGPLWHRFGLRDPRPARLAWDLPEGWKHARTPTREFNFVVDGDTETSAYFTGMAKRAGTLADNVNRWRRQMGLEALSQAAVDALPRKKLFDEDAIFVDVEGDYTAMDGVGAKSGWRLLGLMFEAMDQYFFFKMTGPTATVTAQRDAFLALAASFRSERQGAGPAPPPKPSAKLTWKTPQGWTSQGKSGIREVTFAVDGTKAQCWVLFLGGTAGGIAANANRWLGEVGRPPLDDEGIAKLERLDVLGTQGVLVEGEGDYQGMGGTATEGAALYGLICPLAGRTLFVKMVGPADAMKSQREHFVALCKSLALSE